MTAGGGWDVAKQRLVGMTEGAVGMASYFVLSPSSFMDRKSCMRREGTPAWMQVVERRLEQAAEDARSRPAQAGIQWFRQAIPAWRE